MAKWSRRAGVVIGTVGLTVGVFSTPAFAHDYWVYKKNGLGGNQAGAHISSGHLTIGVCDYLADGLGARAEYKTSAGGSDYVGDANGSASGCGSESSYDGSTITQFRACVRDSDGHSSCTGWVAT